MKKKNYIQFEDGSAVLKKERKKIGFKELIISIILTILLFVCLLFFEGKMLSKYEKTSVVIAKCAISKNIEITAANLNQYFLIKDVPSDDVPKKAILNTNNLLGKVVTDNINEGEIVVEERFSDEEKYLTKFKDPIEIGLSVSSASQIAGGTIRKGDYINIYVLDSGSKDAVEVLKNVYVSKAFDSSGVEIKDVANGAAAVSLNIFIDENQESYFYKMISKGSLFISKILSDPEEPNNNSQNTTPSNNSTLPTVSSKGVQ